jgi:hypothetical protein
MFCPDFFVFVFLLLRDFLILITIMMFTALRTVQNEIRHKINDFSRLNTALSTNVTKLSTECHELQELEVKLNTLADEAGYTSTKLVELVHDNQDILKQERQLIQSDVIQAMIEVVFHADGDESGDLSEREVSKLLIRMKNLPAITVNEELFRLKVMANPKVRAVIDLVQELDMDNDNHGGGDDTDKADRIFELNPDKYQVGVEESK